MKKTTVGHITGCLFIHLFTTHKDEGEHFGSTLVAHAHTHTDTYIYFGTFSEKEHDTHTYTYKSELNGKKYIAETPCIR